VGQTSSSYVSEVVCRADKRAVPGHLNDFSNAVERTIKTI